MMTPIKLMLPGLGLAIAVQAVAPYKSKLPKSEDETEYIENLFNALCSTLMTERNRHVTPIPLVYANQAYTLHDPMSASSS